MRLYDVSYTDSKGKKHSFQMRGPSARVIEWGLPVKAKDVKVKFKKFI